MPARLNPGLNQEDNELSPARLTLSGSFGEAPAISDRKHKLLTREAGDMHDLVRACKRLVTNRTGAGSLRLQAAFNAGQPTLKIAVETRETAAIMQAGLNGSLRKFAVVMPRNMRFSQSKATSIDLCVHDLIAHSRYREGARILCDYVDDPFPGFDILGFRPMLGGNLARMTAIALQCRAYKPDLILVQQHLPTAAFLKRFAGAPVVLQTHNFLKRPKGALGRTIRTGRYASLDGLVLVSDICAADFARAFAAAPISRAVVQNGLDLTQWRPSDVRDRTILVVGRMAPEKGILEAALAIESALALHSDWNATLILSEADRQADYANQVRKVAGRIGDRVTVLEKQPHAVVQSHYEKAAIALVLSKWREPFGRTALEAHAGGAALVSSGTGGLREISGEHALYVDPDDALAVSGALSALMSDEPLRTRLSREGRDRAALFDVRAIAAKLDDFLDSVSENAMHRNSLQERSA